MKQPIIVVDQLVKHYPGVQAVNGISFEVHEGEIFGLPRAQRRGQNHHTGDHRNAARKKTAGSVRVCGYDVDRDVNEIKQRIGVQLQAAGYYPSLTLIELLRLFSGLYNVTIDPMEMLRQVGLEDKGKAKYKELSGDRNSGSAFVPR